MPKKKPGLTPDQQSQRFKDEAQKLIDAGELNPTDAERRLRETLVSGARLKDEGDEL